MNYRAEIDGLRAIAVVSVILYHTQVIIFGSDWFEGGFIGVDIFFVISGYLITHIILNELQETNTFSFIKFYERRARRILPMLLLIIAVCIPFAWQKLLPLNLVDFAKSALSALGFSSNFFFYYSTTEYGADSSLLKPLLHTWSLGVEEQFYLVMPIILVVLFGLRKKITIPILFLFLAGSFSFAYLMSAFVDRDFSFYSPFSRFWELLVGSLLTFFELKYGRLKNQKLANITSVFGLLLIVFSVLFFDKNTVHPGLLTITPVVGVALIILCCCRDDLVGRALSLKPVVALGLMSYSLYLWHFPIFAFYRVVYSEPAFSVKCIAILCTLVLSIASYKLIEQPFRQKSFLSSRAFILVILSFVFLLFGFLGNIVYRDGYPGRLPEVFGQLNLMTNPWSRLRQDGLICFDRTEEFCSFPSASSNLSVNKTTSIYSAGDSIFSSLSPKLFDVVNKKFSYTEMNLNGCPFVLNVDLFEDDLTKGIKSQKCVHKLQNKRYEAIKNDPSIIIIGGQFQLYTTNFAYNAHSPTKDKLDPWGEFKSIRSLSFEEEFQYTINELEEIGHQIVLVYPIPEFLFAAPAYIIGQSTEQNLEDIKKNFTLLSQGYEKFLERAAPTFRLFDSIKSDNVYRVYPHTIFCDTFAPGQCVANTSKDIFYADQNHPSEIGSEMIVKLIMEQIERAEKNIRKN